MKNFLIFLFVITSFSLNSQSVSCSELTTFIEENGDKQYSYSHTFMTCSDFLNSVEFYTWMNPETYETNYYAICKLNFRKYLYASSYELMTEWNKYADTDQCGEAWHQYIKPYKVDCY